MLEIKVIMNSSIEEVLSFKCCSLHDQNLEIHLKNKGSTPVAVPSACSLFNENEHYQINTLFPVGGFIIMPGETQACYSFLDEEIYLKFQWIVFKDNQVLLVRRGQPPSQDLWAIPGGRVHIGETLQQAAEREIFEETGIIISAHDPVYTFDYIERDGNDNVRFHYVIVDLRADYISGKLRAGDDAAEVRWVGPDEMERLRVSSKTVRLLKEEYDFG